MTQANQSLIDEKLKELRREGEEREAMRRAEKLNLPYLDLRAVPVSADALGIMPEAEAREAKSAVLEIKEAVGEAVVVSVNPASPPAKKFIQVVEQKNYKPLVRIVSESGLNYVLGFYQFVPRAEKEIAGSIDISPEKIDVFKTEIASLGDLGERIKELKRSGGDTSESLEIILAGALILRASDIHFEPEEKNVKLRLRIDGLLHDLDARIPQDVYEHLVSRIKLLSNLKLNIHDEPQDGNFSAKLPQKEIELRVSVAPAEYGEVVVMRVLDPETIGMDLFSIGFRKDDLEIIEEELKKPQGMILVTGPTGSGKTTTLYAFLKHKQTPEIKIITIEDPIEYHLDGIEQTEVREGTGYTFGSGLKAIMRQDPDVILVGEIRDEETAGIAVQSALTGHMVFSTVHANDAAGAIPRLLDLKVRPSSIGPALNLIIGQRLVRRLCEYCRKPEAISADLEKKISKFIARLPERVDKKEFKEIKIYQAVGCEKCGRFGYKGRIAVAEVMPIGSVMENLIKEEASETDIRRSAVKNGMVKIQEDGILKVVSGVTTLEEVESATGPIIWDQ